ncbi:MAG: SDR family oxidoreductase [bacterium]|nr:SDR family oxidoreductase [bacterium]
MNLGLKDKVAIIMASSRGLGKATAIQLAIEGAHIVIGARDIKSLEEAVSEIKKQSNSKVLFVQTDVTKSEDLNKIANFTLKEFGKIDILVNNAGGPPPGIFEELTDEQWKQAFELNLMSAVKMIRLVIPSMKQTGSGRIINMTSVAVKQPIDNLILSNSLRSAVIGMAKTLSKELAPFNITVNNVATGYFLTDRLRSFYQIDEKIKQGKTQAEVLQDLLKDVPMKRLGKPEEFGQLISFLASEQAAYITGTTIQIDGGLTKSIL